MYFSRFNPIFPILHGPTFRPSAENGLLLISICSVGSLFVGSAEAAHQGYILFERLNKAVLASVRSHTFPRMPAYADRLREVGPFSGSPRRRDGSNGPGGADRTDIWNALWCKYWSLGLERTVVINRMLRSLVILPLFQPSMAPLFRYVSCFLLGALNPVAYRLEVGSQSKYILRTERTSKP
jgi:hypothetical protein